MIARFRPTYNYSDIIMSIFSSRNRAQENLKKELEDIYKTKNIYFFNNGRSAIYSLLRTLNIKGGVLSPAYNCIVVPDAVRYAGYENQFVDISLDDYNINEQSLSKTANRMSKILFATHQYGIPCDIERMKHFSKKNNLFLFEDSAAAMGAKYKGNNTGTFGQASVVSFQDTKVISGIEGGCLIINDKRLAEVVKNKFDNVEVNSNTLAIKSAIYKTVTLSYIYPAVFKVWTRKVGSYTSAEKSEKKKPKNYVNNINSLSLNLVSRQISGLDKNIRDRNRVANFYFKHIKDVNGVILPKIKSSATPAWTRFPIRVNNKINFFEKMVKQGVDLAWTFSYSCAQEYKSKKPANNSLIAANTVLDLPIYPSLSEKELIKIVTAVKNSL